MPRSVFSIRSAAAAAVLLALAVPTPGFILPWRPPDDICDLVPKGSDNNAALEEFRGWNLTHRAKPFLDPLLMRSTVELAPDVVLVQYRCAVVDGAGCFWGPGCRTVVADASPHRCEATLSPRRCFSAPDVSPLPLVLHTGDPAPYLLRGYHTGSFYHFVFEVLACFLVALDPATPPPPLLSPPLPRYALAWLRFLRLPAPFMGLTSQGLYPAGGLLAAHCPPNPSRSTPQIRALRGRAVETLQRQPPEDETPPDVLILSRRFTRAVKNHAVLVATLRRRFPSLSVVDVFLETLPIPRALAMVRGARVIVSPHGAQLSHIAFADHPNVVEFLPASWQATTNRMLACNYIALILPGKGYADVLTAPVVQTVRAVRLLLALSRNTTLRQQCATILEWRARSVS